ncbi:hypothetical protein ACWDRX_31490 [Streptomyces nigra]
MDVALPDESVRLFRWNGLNSQTSRLHAAHSLLALMLELERAGRNYHLVGHSHGGSVIWEALISAEVTRKRGTVYAELRRALNDPEVRLGDQPLIPERRDEYAPWWLKYKTRYIPMPSEYEAIRSEIKLRGLRSWTTVGTPFMRYIPVCRPPMSRCRSLRTPSDWRVLGKEFADLVLVFSVFLPSAAIFAVMVGAEWVRSAMTSDTANALAYPFALWWLVALWMLRAGDYSDSLLARELAARSAFSRYSGRWLGLWSPSDEAINMLSASAHHCVKYERLRASRALSARRELARLPHPIPLPRLAVPEPIRTITLIPHAQRTSMLSVTKPVIAFVNRWLEPMWRRKIARALARRAQGSDLPRAVAAYISPWPLPLAYECTHSGLPTRTVVEIDRQVAERNAVLVPKVRELLMVAALEGIPEAERAVREGQMESTNALVHTSYFTNPDVRKLILLHICQTRTSVNHDSVPVDDELAIWLADHLEASQTRFVGLSTADSLKGDD